MSHAYAATHPLPTGGEAAVLSDPGPRFRNLHHVSIASHHAGTAVSICEGDNLDNDANGAAAHARIAAEVSAAAAVHTANPAAGVYAARTALETSLADDQLPFPPQAVSIVTSLVTAVITDWTIDLCWMGESVQAFALTTDQTLHTVVQPHPHGARPHHAIPAVRRRHVWREPPGESEHDDPVLDLHRFLLCSDSLTLPLGVADLTRILRRDTSAAITCAELVHAATQRGALDNLTVALIDFPPSTTTNAAEAARTQRLHLDITAAPAHVARQTAPRLRAA